MKDSKWFCTVVVVFLLGVNTLSILLLNANRLTAKSAFLIIGAVFLIATIYLIVNRKSITKNRSIKLASKSE